jgi:SPP1 family predicted phage head-tail adaptor
MSIYQGSRNTQVGTMRHRIIVQQMTEVADAETGQPTRTWSTFGSNVPAAFSDGRGSEGFRGSQVEAQAQAVFTVRYRAGYGPTMRIYFDGAYYGITHVRQVAGYKRYLELHCNIVDNGGVA